MRDADLPSYVVVSGPPGSGKTTLGRQLATELHLPLIAKDTIKQALMSVNEVPDVAGSRLVGRASVAVLLAVAEDVGYGVLESVWHRSRAISELRRLPGSIVEVFCSCSRSVAEDRYRARSGSRTCGHFDDERLSTEIWNDEVAAPVGGGWPVLEVDTNREVDLKATADLVRQAFSVERA